VSGEPDGFDVRRARGAQGLLGAFNAAGVLVAADVHVATRLAELARERDERVRLAAALAVRAPRLGHVHVDLATIRETATVDAEEPAVLADLPWPRHEEWLELVATSELVAVGEAAGAEPRPLRLVGGRLYLHRYWQEERRIAADLRALAARPVGGVDLERLAAGVERLFATRDDARQRAAAASALLGRLTVVAGGPGTGKTTTVARIVALLAEQPGPPPLVALAAPTGKAAARLEQAVHEEAAELPVDDVVRAQLLALRASTLHRLLGRSPGSHSRFRHGRQLRLPHDLVLVDETSMVSLSLMGRLVEAVRPDARLVLVGDPGQLAAIEAGDVLGDIVGPALQAPRIGPRRAAPLARVTGIDATRLTGDDTPATIAPRTGGDTSAAGVRRADDAPVTGAHSADPGAPRRAGTDGIGDGIVVLDRVYRHEAGIARLADAIRRGDADAVLAALRASEDVTWIDVDVADPTAQPALAPLREGAVAAAGDALAAARAGDSRAALAALGRFRLLCAHRRGPAGVASWTGRIEGWLQAQASVRAEQRWYAGRPLLVTRNDYELQLANGDTGIVVQAGPDRLVAAFDRHGEVVEHTPERLGAVDTVYAMTIHKSQGSQFDTAAVLLPAPDARILTRELLYTALTRARERLIVAGSAASVRAAVERPIARSSGLRDRLWSE